MEDTRIDDIPRIVRPPITCLAVGMNKVVTTHNTKYIRLWKFSSQIGRSLDKDRSFIYF